MTNPDCGIPLLGCGAVGLAVIVVSVVVFVLLAWVSHVVSKRDRGE